MSSGALPQAIFHVVLTGRAYFRTGESDDWTELKAGQMVLLPFGSPHILASEPTVQPVPIHTLQPSSQAGPCPTVTGGGPGTVTEIACGMLGSNTPGPSMLLLGLPLALFGRSEGTAQWMEANLRLLEREFGHDGSASALVVNRLSEVLLLQLLQASGQHHGKGLEAAQNDLLIGPICQEIIAEPGRPWSLASICKVAGGSRSAVHKRFLSRLGVSPMRFVRTWRLQVAAMMIRQGSSVEEASIATGYASGNSLSQAFRQQTGRSPVAYRSTKA